MPVTSIKVSTDVRDRLAAVAACDFDGATLGDAVARLIDEHAEAKTRLDMISASCP